MAYIIENDVRVLLPERDVNILLERNTGGNSEAFLTQRVLFAIDFVKSKIQHRFDPSQIFIDVNYYDPSVTYNEGDLLFYTESDYDNATDYSIGDHVSYNNYIYELTTEAPAGTLPTDTNFWTLRASDEGYYSCIAESTGNYPYNTDYFAKGDTRHQLILTYTLYIAVYELFKRVQPNQVPSWLISSRDEAEAHLNRIARGTDTANLPIYEDTERGQEIHYNFKYPSQDYDF